MNCIKCHIGQIQFYVFTTLVNEPDASAIIKAQYTSFIELYYTKGCIWGHLLGLIDQQYRLFECREKAKKIKWDYKKMRARVCVCCQPKGSCWTHHVHFVLLRNEYYVKVGTYIWGAGSSAVVLLCFAEWGISNCAKLLCCHIGWKREMGQFLAFTKWVYIIVIYVVYFNELNTVVAFRASRRDWPFF